MTLASVAVEEVLLVLKIAFLVLLYLFIWRIVRTASRDLRTPQESFVLAPHSPEAQVLRGGGSRLVVVRSPALSEGQEHHVDAAPLTIGRGPQNVVPIADDDFASAEHARFESRRDGIWVEDVGSTNGTFVNGARLERPRKLTPGDVVRVGETDLRFDA
ncbi:MAG: FHA domain-containing protein [Gaiellaceae bacterium]